MPKILWNNFVIKLDKSYWLPSLSRYWQILIGLGFMHHMLVCYSCITLPRREQPYTDARAWNCENKFKFKVQFRTIFFTCRLRTWTLLFQQNYSPSPLVQLDKFARNTFRCGILFGVLKLFAFFDHQIHDKDLSLCKS